MHITKKKRSKKLKIHNEIPRKRKRERQKNLRHSKIVWMHTTKKKKRKKEKEARAT